MVKKIWETIIVLINKYLWWLFLYMILYVLVGSRFSDRAQYNEFIESGSKSWALIRRRLVLGVKNTQNRAAQRPREKGPLTRGRESPTPLGHIGASFLSLSLPLLLGRLPPPLPFLWVISVVIYSSRQFILLLHLSVIHTYPQVHVPSVILSGVLWAAVALIALSRGHIHINGVRVLAVGI